MSCKSFLRENIEETYNTVELNTFKTFMIVWMFENMFNENHKLHLL